MNSGEGRQQGHGEIGEVTTLSASGDSVSLDVMPVPRADGLIDSFERGRVFEALFRAPREPQKFGRYVVLGTLGKGGMGTVFEAFDRDLDRRVAIKVLHGKLDARHSARLVREAQAMAKLSHPNVVQVYEVGEVEGQTFVVMELVKGQTLREWVCREPRPHWRACVEVFLEVGAGLVAAHARGLVHRDFKPNNAIVDEDGRPRLLDFGLVRQVESESDEPSVVQQVRMKDDELALNNPLTKTNTVLGTPAYMSPEQMKGHEADARSDQFSFCVSLYEALYGERPYAGSSLMELMSSMTRGAVRSVPRGSTVPMKLRVVLLRGLAFDPERRWPSMVTLLAQLRRSGAPRGRNWMALSVVVGLGAIAGGLAYQAKVAREVEQARQAELAQRCSGARRHLKGAWDAARTREVEKAILGTGLSYAPSTWDRVRKYLDDYANGWANAHASICEATAVRHEQSPEVMDLRMSCLRRRLVALREATEVLAQADARRVENAVKLVAGLPRLSRCDDVEALKSEVPAPEDPKIAQEVEVLRGRLAKASAFYDTGEYPRGIEVAAAVVEHARGLGYPPLLAEALETLGLLQTVGAGAVEAETTLREAISQGAVAHADRSVAAAWTHLLFVLARQRRSEEGLAFELPARAAVDWAGDDVIHSWLLNNLGIIHGDRGEHERARELLRESLELKRAALGDGHVDVGITWFNLGNTLTDGGRLAEASQAFARAKEIFESTVGPEHPRSHFALSGQCRVEQAQGHSEVAVSLCAEVLEHFEVLPPSPMWIGRVNFTLASAQWDLGREEAARRSARRAREAIEDEDPEMVARITAWLAEREPTVADDVEGDKPSSGAR